MEFIEVYAILFQIYVKKNLYGENLCGEKMTNMRSVLAELEFGQLLKNVSSLWKACLVLPQM